eukprot:TRINITY_DN1215_c0_g1_i3.p1 TRINITY_DN1215_c0_g1~~TRINITY_DN1215_c0_g1_i3.p1  ORF type:complete len:190 (+),score=44.66 TRINITY_DN1215_c0_g1_i3:53-622(+)
MFFRFCGGDAPDWILGDIALLSKVSAIKMRMLCAQIAAKIAKNEIDYAKVTKLTADANFSQSDVKAAVAALHWIFTNATKHDVEESVLVSELQQLGFPKEHSEGLGRVYRDQKGEMHQQLAREVLTVSKLEALDWRLNYVLSSSSAQELNAPTVELKIATVQGNEKDCTVFEMSGDKFLSLHQGMIKQL